MLGNTAMESDKVPALKWCCRVDRQRSFVTPLQMIGVMEFSICDALTRTFCSSGKDGAKEEIYGTDAANSGP